MSSKLPCARPQPSICTCTPKRLNAKANLQRQLDASQTVSKYLEASCKKRSRSLVRLQNRADACLHRLFGTADHMRLPKCAFHPWKDR
eukprot:5467800-Pleurochrysis_carterae.AAC.1